MRQIDLWFRRCAVSIRTKAAHGSPIATRAKTIPARHEKGFNRRERFPFDDRPTMERARGVGEQWSRGRERRGISLGVDPISLEKLGDKPWLESPSRARKEAVPDFQELLAMGWGERWLFSKARKGHQLHVLS